MTASRTTLRTLLGASLLVVALLTLRPAGTGWSGRVVSPVDALLNATGAIAVGLLVVHLREVQPRTA